jgi:mono/diheme cytochrome c family protein
MARINAPSGLKFILAGVLMMGLRTAVSDAAAAGGIGSSNASGARSLYMEHCAQCHGSSGKGDGAQAAHLNTRIRSFANCDWMAMRSDATLFLLIKDGSGAIGLLPEMPPFDGRLDDKQITELIGYVRSFCPDRSGPGGSG